MMLGSWLSAQQTDARCLWCRLSGSSAARSTAARTRARSKTARGLVDPLRLREGEQTSEMGEVDYRGKKSNKLTGRPSRMYWNLSKPHRENSYQCTENKRIYGTVLTFSIEFSRRLRLRLRARLSISSASSSASATCQPEASR